MALPTIEYPVYTTTLPSTGEEVKFRPYIVKEENILLTALSGDSIEEMTEALKQLIASCTFNKIDPEKITGYDAEFLFLQIRIKSVSPTVELEYKVNECPEKLEKQKEGDEEIEDLSCDKNILVGINLEDVCVQATNEHDEWKKLNGTEEANKKSIQITDSVGITLRHPTLNDLSVYENVASDEKKTELDALNALILSCVVNVFDEEAVRTRSDFTDKELEDFYSALLTSQKQELISYMENLPILRHEVCAECKKCGFKQNMVYEGLKSFFV